MNRPEEPVARPSYEEWRLTHPPIMGADDGTVGEVAAEILGAVEPESVEAAAAAPQEGTSGDAGEQADLGLSFRLEDVPEDYREHVERYTKQVQGAFTRKTQELASQRRELEPLLSRQQRLQSDDERDKALAEFVTQHGWEVGGDDVDEFEDDGVDDTPAAPVAEAAQPDSELTARLAQLEAAEQARQQQAYQAQVRTHVESALQSYADEKGLVEVPDAVKAGIAAQLRGLDPIDGNLPDMAQAIALYEEQQALAVQAYLQTKRVPDFDLSGAPSAQPTFNPRDPQQRRARADAIVGRHL